MSVNLYNLAIKTAREASKLDAAGKNERASFKYLQAFDILISLVSHTEDKRLKEFYTERAEQYLTRVNELKCSSNRLSCHTQKNCRQIRLNRRTKQPISLGRDDKKHRIDVCNVDLAIGLQIQIDIFEALKNRTVTKIQIASSTLKDFVLEKNKSAPLLFSDLINDLSYRGTNIQILTTPKMLCSKFFSRLNKEVKVRTCARSHLKLICIDNDFAYIGTANLTSAAVGLRLDTRRNFEVGLTTRDKIAVTNLANYFDEIWTGYHCGKCVYVKRKEFGCTIPHFTN